jgi:hypothetical protein
MAKKKAAKYWRMKKRKIREKERARFWLVCFVLFFFPFSFLIKKIQLA